MNSSTKIALVITLLDAMGIGLIMPVLPTLLREFIASEDIANHFGVLLALYALMQVIFAPWLGKMSDRFGRRPVLLLSLIGASLDYLLLAFSSALWMLYLGRFAFRGSQELLGLSRHRSLPIPPQLLNA